MPLPLFPIADVTYNIPGLGAPREGFNLGLIIGNSTVISTTTRVVVYNSLQAMITAGFTTGEAEYLAAQAYFSQVPQPTQVAIGVQGGGETPLEAIQACRVANQNWYIAFVTTAADADHEAIAAYVETLTSPYSLYFLNSSESAIPAGTGGNLFATLFAGLYKRTLGQFSSNAYAAASIMGYPMAATTDFSNSAYTLAFQKEPGITAEPLTVAQVATIEGYNGNVYVQRGAYTGFEKGTMFSGDWFDEILYLDKLTNEIQLNVADLLYSSPKVPQTEAGMSLLRNTVSAACQDLVSIGFIAKNSTWSGGNILTLSTGDPLPNGFIVMSDSIASQTSGQRASRISPNIYACIQLAGAIQSVFIQVNVSQ